MDCGEPAIQGLLPGIWVEATLGEVDVDVDGAILLNALQGGATERRKMLKPLTIYAPSRFPPASSPARQAV